MAQNAADAGVHALIVQDLGLAWLLRRTAPDLPLHASTQTAALTTEALSVLSEMGFSRIIGPREWTMTEIKSALGAVPGLEVEVFIHGALCWSVSGQCLFSEHLTGRSANRGDCAGPCRGRFSIEGKEGAWFSLKDLQRGPGVQELRKLGVASAKIEGRMKDPDTVRSVTSYYRSLLDTGKEPRRRVFFSRATVTDPSPCKKAVTTPEWAGSWGIPLGRAGRIVGTMVEITPLEPLALHDGLLVRTAAGWQPAGVTALQPGPSASAHQRVLLGCRPLPQPGTEVRLIRRHDAKTSDIHPDSLPAYHPPLRLKAEWQPGALKVTDTSISFSHLFPLPAEPSKSPGRRALETFSTGAEYDIEWEEAFPDGWPGAFAPPSHLKQAAREWWPMLARQRLRERTRAVHNLLKNLSIPSLSETPSDWFSLPHDSWDTAVAAQQWNLWRQVHPGPAGILLNNLGHGPLAREIMRKNPDVQAAAGPFLYPENPATLAAWSHYLGHKGLTLSKDTRQAPLMTARHCLRLSRWGTCVGCPGEWTLAVTQNGKTYRAIGNCERTVLEQP